MTNQKASAAKKHQKSTERASGSANANQHDQFIAPTSCSSSQERDNEGYTTVHRGRPQGSKNKKPTSQKQQPPVKTGIDLEDDIVMDTYSTKKQKQNVNDSSSATAKRQPQQSWDDHQKDTDEPEMEVDQTTQSADSTNQKKGAGDTIEKKEFPRRLWAYTPLEGIPGIIKKS